MYIATTKAAVVFVVLFRVMITVVAVGLITAALLALWLALRLRRATGLPWGDIVASDTDGLRTLARPLYASRYGLTGKPDYIMKIDGTYIPVEIKPGRQAQKPYESDLMQLAAYCLLIEETYGTAPAYGLLRYTDRTFRVDYDDAIYNRLLDILDDMRVLLDASDCERSHNEARRCARCGFVDVCAEALVD